MSSAHFVRLATICVAVGSLLLVPEPVEACSFGCEERAYQLFGDPEAIPTHGVVQVISPESYQPRGGWCEREVDVVVRDANGDAVAGELRAGTWRSTSPLAAGSRYGVELRIDGRVVESRAVVAVEVDTSAREPVITATAREIVRNCAWSCCPSYQENEWPPRTHAEDDHDTFYTSCSLEADCSSRCTQLCGVTAKAWVPQLELTLSMSGTIVDDYLEFQFLHGGHAGEVLGWLPPWKSVAGFGRVDMLAPPEDDDARAVAYAGFLLGQPLCMTVVARNRLSLERSAPMTICVDEVDVARLPHTTPDVSSVMSQFCSDTTALDDTRSSDEVLGAWCGDETPLVLEPSGGEDTSGAADADASVSDTSAPGDTNSPSTDAAARTVVPSNADDGRGCGCRSVGDGESSPPWLAWLGLVAVGLAVRRRRLPQGGGPGRGPV